MASLYKVDTNSDSEDDKSISSEKGSESPQLSSGGEHKRRSRPSSGSGPSSQEFSSADTTEDDLTLDEEVRLALATLRNNTLVPEYYVSQFKGSLHFLGCFYLEHAEQIEQYATTSRPSSKQREKYVEDILKLHRYKDNLISNTQLGDKSLVLEFPVNLTSLFTSPLIDLACGPNSWAAITAAGEVYMEGPRGLNPFCLGRSSKTDTNSRIAALSGKKIIGIESGTFHTVAFSKEKVYTWGYNINCSTLGINGEANAQSLQNKGQPKMSFQLGREPTKPFDLPEDVTGIKGTVYRVACGASHSAALTSEGIWTWGLNDEGQLGHDEDPKVPNLVKNLLGKQVVHIACGAHHTMAVLENGWVYAWGWNAQQQLGFNDKEIRITTPRRIETLNKVVTDVACGNTHSACITDDGGVWTWGSNQYGELGRKKGNSPQQLKIKGIRVISVDCGGDSTGIVSDEGDVWIWGRLAGQGFNNNQWEPRRLEVVRSQKLGIKKVALGYSHVALLADQRVTAALHTLYKTCREDTAVPVTELKNKLASVTPPELLTTIQNRVHEEMHNEGSPKPCIALSSAHLKFDEEHGTQNITIRNLRSKKVNISFTIPIKELPRGDNFEIIPKMIELKSRGTAKFSIVHKSGDPLYGMKYFNFLTLHSEIDKKKSHSYYFVQFAVNKCGVKGLTKQTQNNVGKLTIRPANMSMESLTQVFSSNTKQVEIMERLGGGGSGATVYRCTVNGIVCAVKLLDLSNTPDDNVENFVKEIKLLEALEHNNIIKYLGHDLADGIVRCFMEYYPYSLYMLIKRRQKEGFTVNEIAFMGREIANGLNYLHTLPSKIIHRDLKSGNILIALDENDEVKTVKITDFDASAIMNNTQMNVTIIGTGAWMAPEVFSREGYSVEADIWSFGMLLFEMVALKQPYHSVPPMQVSALVIKGVLPEFPAEPAPEYKPIIDIMKVCLILEPQARPTAAMLSKMFGKLL